MLRTAFLFYGLRFRWCDCRAFSLLAVSLSSAILKNAWPEVKGRRECESRSRRRGFGVDQYSDGRRIVVELRSASVIIQSFCPLAVRYALNKRNPSRNERS